MVVTSSVSQSSRQHRAPASGTEVRFADCYDGAAAFICRSAAAVARELAVSSDDQEDVQQELWLVFLEAVASSDSATLDIESALFDVMRRAGRLLRELASRPADLLRTQLPCGTRTSPQELRQFELSEDLASSLARLPYPLRRLARRLEEETPAEIASRVGVSRSAIYAKIARLRRRFEAANLDEYLREP